MLISAADYFIFIVFIIISFSHFIISYFLNKNQLNGISHLNLKTFLKNLIRRFNYDIFRFNGDLSLLVLFLLYFKIDQTLATILFFILLFFGFVYLIYYHIIKKTYNSEPLLINDVIFLRLGITLAMGGFLLYSILFLVLLFLLILIFCYISIFFVEKLYSINGSTIPLLITVLFSSVIALFSSVKYFNHPTIFGFLTCPSPFFHFLTNIYNSFKAYKSTKAFSQIDFKALQKLESIKMDKQPNFHFLVSESYGKIFYKAVEAKPELRQKCIKIEKKLQKGGWHIISNFSHAPISGGGSWLSYSSLLKGIKIESHNKYHTLLKDSRHLAYYPFLKLLANSGYKSYFLSALGGYEKVKINMNQLLTFLGAEYLIRYKDLKYNGKEFGLGPSPPDQFSLNKGFEIMKKQFPNDPIAYFFITQNSHALWYGPDKIVDDWKELSKKDYDGCGYISDKDLSTRYEKSILYQLNTFVDFIMKQNSDNLFLIIGDHQPYSDKANSEDYSTPIHIVSKDQEYIKSFMKFGFTYGLLPKPGNELYHQAVHSMLLQNLQKCYGSKSQPKINYYKNGIWD